MKKDIAQVKRDLYTKFAASLMRMLEFTGADRQRLEQSYGIEAGGLKAWVQARVKKLREKAEDIANGIF